MSQPFDDEMFAALHDAAREAGDLALCWFEPGQPTRANVEMKAGNSPVTEADKAVDQLLHRRLRAIVPEAAWLSEETFDDGQRIGEPLVLIVDPIDGTRGFMAGAREWCVSIALVENGRPIMAVLYAPALGEMFGAALGRGATRNNAAIRVSSKTSLAGARIAGPRPLLLAMQLEGESIEIGPKIPSLAYRMALVADGRLDGAVASPNAHDWDIAAADLIVSEAGGVVVDHGSALLRYNKPSTEHQMLFAGNRELAAALFVASRLRGQNDARAIH